MNQVAVFMLAVCCLVVSGCQRQLDFAQQSHPWKECQLDAGAVSFRYPSGLKRHDRCSEPLAFQLVDRGNKFAILVVSDARQADRDYPAEMLDSTIEKQYRIGSPQPTKLGEAEGLVQEHRSWEDYGYRRGRTTVLTTDNRVLVFEVSYMETYQDQLEPVFNQVISSLKLEQSETENSLANAVRQASMCQR